MLDVIFWYEGTQLMRLDLPCPPSRGDVVGVRREDGSFIYGKVVNVTWSLAVGDQSGATVQVHLTPDES